MAIKRTILEGDPDIYRPFGDSDTFGSLREKLVGTLTAGDLATLLKEWGIEVLETCQDMRRVSPPSSYSFNIVASDSADILVAIEVAIDMDIESVKDFLDKMKDFRSIHGSTEDRNVYGAVAYRHVKEKADAYAERNGLFVIKATAKRIAITNEKTFKPKNF